MISHYTRLSFFNITDKDVGKYMLQSIKDLYTHRVSGALGKISFKYADNKFILHNIRGINI